MAYSKNAFNCSKCPGKSGDGGCPAFWETTWTNPSGEVKLIKDCAFAQMPLYFIELIKAANRPAAAIESTRNEIVGGFAALVEAARHVKQIEKQ